MVYSKNDYGFWHRFTDNKEDDIEKKLQLFYFIN